MIKAKRNAVELAKLVRSRLAEPKLRIAVFPKGKGWEAKAYADNSSSRQLQKRIDEIALELNGLYELEN
jgi:hypothetical protein